MMPPAKKEATQDEKTLSDKDGQKTELHLITSTLERIS